MGRTGLCHDFNDTSECSGGRRLYYTAYGDPICDCLRGQFPFPGPRDNCVAIFTRATCPSGQLLTFNSAGALTCSLDNFSGRQQTRRQQQDTIIGNRLQSIPADDGLLYPLGSPIPCPNSFLFDYDFFKMKAKCTDINSFEEDDEPFDDSCDRPSFVDNVPFRVSAPIFSGGRTTPPNNRKRFIISSKHKMKQRQDSLTSGLFQVPSSFPQDLLNSCRPGSKNGNNFKCRNSAL